MLTICILIIVICFIVNLGITIYLSRVLDESFSICHRVIRENAGLKKQKGALILEINKQKHLNSPINGYFVSKGKYYEHVAKYYRTEKF